MSTDVIDLQRISSNQALTKGVLEEIDNIRSLFESKNDQYKVSPVVTLPLESWLHQIRIKAERALQATNDEKRKDEMRDCAVYCLLGLAKMNNEAKYGPR